MMPANKHMDPVVGVDIHIVMIPSPAGPIPTPLPHPFVGMIMDPMDYVPVIGATVMVNKTPRGNSTTAGMLGSKVHIPMGGPFMMSPTIGHDSTNFFGSPRVTAEGSYFSASGYMVMSCNDVGMPLTPVPGKKMKPKAGMYLPSSATIPIPKGPPVIVGGPYAPDLMAAIMGAVMSFGMGAAMKAAGKGLKKLNHAVLKKFPATQGLSKKLCKMGFEPVDLVTGRMVYEGEDFYIPGIIPIAWQRDWFSDSEYQGILGYGNFCNYETAIHIEQNEQLIVMQLAGGRLTSFPILIAEDDSFYNRTEKLTLTCIDKNTYTVKDHETGLINTFKRSFNDTFNLISISDEDGMDVKLIYSPSYKLQGIIDTAGRKINIELDDMDRAIKISAVHDGAHKLLIEYAYNKDGDLSEITDALGKTTYMEYQNHLMVKKTDRNGQSFYWEYDGKKTGAKCIKTWGDGNVLAGTITYGKGKNLVTNSLGHRTTYYFDSNNLCTQVTDAEGGHIFHEYTDFMEPYRDIDEAGNITGYCYDERGNLTSLVQPDGSAFSYIYDDSDKLILTSTPEGTTTARTFQNGKLHASQDALGNTTIFNFNDLGLIRTINDGLGNKTLLEYDKDHNLAKMIRSSGGESTWKYDAWGKVIETSNPENRKSHFNYDALGRISKAEQPDGNIISIKYNSYDEIIKTIDSKKNQIEFEYTALGKLKSRKQNGSKVEFKYNTEEQLLAIINENNEYYRVGRNRNGQIINETGFDGLRRDFQRDQTGKLLKVIQANEKFTEYEYNVNGQMTRIEYNDSTWETFSYNSDGLLTEAANANSILKLTRNTAGKISSESQDGYLVESNYDSFGNRIEIKSSLGANIQLDRNKLGHIKKMKASIGKNDESWDAKFKYNSLGQELDRLMPGGINSSTTYDKAGRPVEQRVNRSKKEIRNNKYAWNINHQLSKMVNELSSGSVFYSYDAFGNLASAKYEDNQFDYKLPDEVGNLYRSKGQKDKTYGAGGKLLKSRNTAYKYDLEGNLIKKITEKGDWDYQWQANGLLKSLEKPNGEKLTFEYDALRRRTAKIVKPRMSHKDSIIKRWVWDWNVPLHEWEYHLKDRPKWIVNNENELVQDRNEPLGYNIISDIAIKEESPIIKKCTDFSGFITWIFDEGTSKPAAKIVDGKFFSILTNYLGTPVEMYNSKGEKTWEVAYDIYGKIRKIITGSIEDCPFRYQGQYEDVETGLYYNRFRYYDADNGTYISQDPIRTIGGIALYAYVNDTNSWIDILGLCKDRWKKRKTKEGVPHRKPGPKPAGEGDHNMKIAEIIDREVAAGNTHTGGGTKTEEVFETPGGFKDTRRMDASFKRADGSVYHINVGRTWADGTTPIIREREALADMVDIGEETTFEGYGKEKDYPKKVCK